MANEIASQEDLSKYLTAPLLQKPEKPLQGKAALITGATRFNGIGFAIAERFALEGASPLILVGTENSRNRASFIEQRLKMYGIDAYTLIGDIKSEESVTAMMEQAYQYADGNVYILVNNAGVAVSSALTDVTRADWDNVMETKALGALLMTREWFRIRNESEDNIKGGRVINIGSIIGIHGNSGQAVYEMANAALIALTKGLRIDLGRRGINVNLLAPTFVEGTDMTVNLDLSPDALKAVTPLGVLVAPQDIAGVAAFLAGPDGSKIDGVVLPVDCGIEGNYNALRGLHFAGFRKIPRVALGIAENLTREDVIAVQERRKFEAEGGKNG